MCNTHPDTRLYGLLDKDWPGTCMGPEVVQGMTGRCAQKSEGRDEIEGFMPRC